jgi:hypothetical protein
MMFSCQEANAGSPVFRSDRKKPLFRESVACGERQRVSFYCEAKKRTGTDCA